MSTPVLGTWEGQVADLRVGAGTPFRFRREGLQGLSRRPSVRDQDEDVVGGDGVHTGDDTLDARVLTLRIDVDPRRTGTTMAAALADLEQAFRPKRDIESWWRLPVWSTPRRLSVRVRNYAVPEDAGLTSATYADVQLLAAAPVLYGPEPAGAAVEFPQQLGGLRYPLYTDGTAATGYLDYGPPSTSGRFLLRNEGSAEVRPWFEILGPTPPGGFALVRTGDGSRIQFEGPVAAGATLRLDSADGSAVIDGSADRGGQLTWRDWFPVLPGEQIEVAFLPLGPRTSARVIPHAPSGWW